MISPLVLETARRLVPGRDEPRVEALSAGPLNCSYRVQRDGRAYALRVPAQRSAPGIRLLSELGVDREWEQRVLLAAAAEGVAPRVLACEPGSGVLLTAWLDGEIWSAEQAARPDSQPGVARLLRRVHELQPAVPLRRMQAGDWCRLYLDALSRAQPAPADLEVLAAAESQALAALRDYARLPPPVMRLCHSDLHRLNLLHAGARSWLLDWEYAHLGDPFWDLAGWIRSAALGPTACDAWVGAYLQREPRAAERERLECLLRIYDFVCLLWNRLAGVKSD